MPESHTPYTTSPWSSYNPWNTYKRPFVRDLAYAIACPCVLTYWVDHNPLLNTPDVSVHDANFWQQQFEAYTSRLSELDNSKAYQDLTRFLLNRPSPHRLGFHFEGLIHFWLIDGFEQGIHQLEVLAHNVQLYRGKQTIGELDYILRNHKTNEIEHWELAIKFFMGHPPYDFSDWVGLNSRDNLELKMTHMQSRQFNSIWVDIELKSIELKSDVISKTKDRLAVELNDTETNDIKTNDIKTTTTRENGTDIKSNDKKDTETQRVKVDKRVGVIKGRFFKPIIDHQFVRPDWLTPHFPLHHWIDNRDMAQLSQLNIMHTRRAHYIEWFTKRGFYDGKTSHNYQYKRSNQNDFDKTNKLPDTPNLLTETCPPEMGLYFERGTPFVIYDNNRDSESELKKDKF